MNEEPCSQSPSVQLQCPRCFSSHLVRINERTLLRAGAGAVVGGLLIALLGYARKTKDTSHTVSGVVFGALSGASACAQMDTVAPIPTDARGKFLCMSCLHAFSR
jgi:outer membrane lipoprotein SlyB